MIRAVIDLRNPEDKITYDYWRVGRVRGKIVSNDKIIIIPTKRFQEAKEAIEHG